MTCTDGRVAGRATVVTFAVAALLMITGYLPLDVGAQSPAASAGIPALSGTYTQIGRAKGDGWSLNSRAKAIIAAFDEHAGPKWDCVPATAPRIVSDPYNFRIEQEPDRVLLHYEKDDVVRTVWLEGRGHPTPKDGDYWLQGYSTGRYEGNQLVVETTKFTYDPHGMNDASPFIPSSQRKKVAERYWREGTTLMAEVVTEDPLILVRPHAFVNQWEPTNDEWVSFECDIDANHEVLTFMPERY